jgi:hypothetical protein
MEPASTHPGPRARMPCLSGQYPEQVSQKTKPQLFRIPEVTFFEESASHIVRGSQFFVFTTAKIRARLVPVIYDSERKKFHFVRASSLQHGGNTAGAHPGNRVCPGGVAHFLPLLLSSSFIFAVSTTAVAQLHPASPASPLPDAPLPVIKHENSKSGACRVIPKSESSGIALSETGAGFIAALAAFPPPPAQPQIPAVTSAGTILAPRELPPCPPMPLINFYQRFINGPEVKPLTPKEKARLAVKNVLDPFNAVTILANAAISVGSDSHSDYGPGLHGFAKVVGVSYSEDMTGEFFGTFLIPSIVHQDPHYHRMPRATIKRRIFHAVTQVLWTQGDDGKGMLNYSNIVGFPIDLEIANLYVPGEKTNLPSTARRYAFGLALAPTDNFITEFLPDLARRIHVRVVLVQQIINQVAHTEPAGTL